MGSVHLTEGVTASSTHIRFYTVIVETIRNKLYKKLHYTSVIIKKLHKICCSTGQT